MYNKGDILGLAIPKCFFCGKDKNEILMNTMLTAHKAKEVSELHGKVIDLEPCDECKKYMKQGIIIISTRDGDKDYRTGGWVVVKDKFIEDAIDSSVPEGAKLKEQILKLRYVLMGNSAWKQLGLPIDEHMEID